ncbi:hypothetical protein [Halorubrum ezzemoulense]|uniref:Uncharacterized protein n=1 Tax=Halorubrum ezzemoulense TaxID=337243 RepID=A0A256J1V5_HALEZ|nr:hypothetical protein [Halorubrum ezzemoulense]OYR62546.1 hypothetical protein DJ80_09885 [Halorubrum ezzemoulense]
MAVEQLTGVRTDSVIILKDPLTSENAAGNQMGYLRSLPYLFQEGIVQYTFPPGWLRRMSNETFDEVLQEKGDEDNSWFEYCALPDFPFNYTILDQKKTANDLSFHHICQITNQETDEYSSARTTHKLLRAYLDGRIEELFLVTDRASFSLSDTTTHKPLREELDHAEVLSYEKIAKQYIRSQFGSQSIPFAKTLNIWLHHAADDYRDVMGRQPQRIGDLFEFDVLEPGIRTWDLFEFLSTEVSRDSIEHINAVVRPWIESDITKVEANIRNALQEFDYDREAVRTFRETGDRSA